MPFLNRDGVRIYFEERGTGPAVFLTHGYGASARMWHGQMEALSDRYRIIAWDMRGHDRTGYPDDPARYSHEATVGDMAAILDACGVQKAVVGGLSLGGFMTLAFNLAFPDRVTALMLFDCGPGYKKEGPRAEWNRTAMLMADALEKDGLTALSTSAETQVALHRNAHGVALAARGMLTQKDSRAIDSLPAIRVPTLVLAGAEDQPFLASTDYMAAKIPDAQKVILNNAGHAANIDQPAAFNEAVRAFLDRVTATQRK